MIASILCSIVIAFSIFLAINHIPNKNDDESQGQLDYVEIQEKFFKKNNENEKKVFIIGSSYTQALNTTTINSEISTKCTECHVYNLSIQGDNISKRSEVTDLIILANPYIVLYGISETDFAEINNSEYKNAEPLLPDIQELIIKTMQPSKIFEFLEITPSPKDKTWNLIRQINKDESTNFRFTPFPDTPFLKILPASTVIVSELELKSLESNIGPFGIIKEPKNNNALINLKSMIGKFSNKNIKIVFFMVPQHEYFLSKQSIEFQKQFETIADDLQNSTGVNIYPRVSEYSKLKIWHDLSHVAVNEQALIYSEDISKIILKELDD